MKRLVLLLLALLGAFLLGRAVVHSLASDETKIRWLFEDMARGFDRTRMDPILSGFSRDFADESTGADRDTLRQALAYLFFTAKEETTRRFPYRVEVEIGRTETSEDETGQKRARCELAARFFERTGEAERLAWDVDVTAQMERGEDGWRIRRASHKTRSGRMLR